jgi:hypothetical protein
VAVSLVEPIVSREAEEERKAGQTLIVCFPCLPTQAKVGMGTRRWLLIEAASIQPPILLLDRHVDPSLRMTRQTQIPG